PALIFGMLYVLISCFNIRRNFRFENLKGILKPAFAMWFWITFMSLVYFAFNKSGFSLNYTLLSCIISFWLLSNDLNRYEYLKDHFLYIILTNGIFLSILSYLQIGLDIGHMDRQSLLGNNANVIGISSLISVLVIIYLVIENPRKFSKIRFTLLLLIP